MSDQDDTPERFDEPHDDLYGLDGEVAAPEDLDDVIAAMRARADSD